MELAILPILALLGIVFLVDFGGDGDDEPIEPENPETPNGKFNYMQFGPQDDESTGTQDADAMYLDQGDDFATGGEGDDKIFFGDGQDTTVDLTAEGDFDSAGMEGDDFIRGGNGRDILIDSLGANTIYGDTGYDRMSSIDDESDQDTADTMYGGFGNDVLFADDGDTLSGGAGDDRFQLFTAAGDDPVMITDFTAGDELLIRDEDGGYYIAGRVTTGLSDDGVDTNVLLDDQIVAVLQGVTEMPADAIGNPPSPPIFGTVGDDNIIIDDFASQVVARAGDDTVAFAKGADTIGRDMRVNAGSGDDIVTTGAGDDVLLGDLGNDVLTGGTGSDEVYGGYGNDRIDVTDIGVLGQSDTVFGGNGNDRIIGDDGDVLLGEGGVDSFAIDMNDPDATLVIIGDFNPNTEVLTGEVSIDGGAAPVVTYEAVRNDAGDTYATNVLVGSRVISQVIGVVPTDLNATNIMITNSAA
tara:strand:- start:4791 stop:6197 length:1407 start_codon:yes stop_codon:yes gene_type:complete